MWRDDRDGVPGIYVGALNSLGCIASASYPTGMRVSRAGTSASSFILATAGSQTPIVWVDSRLGYRQVWWTCLRADGQPDPRWPPDGARLGVGSSERGLSSVAVADSVAWIATILTSGPRINSWIFRRSLANPDSSPEWPASGLCVTCADTANAYLVSVAPISRDRAFIAYFSSEDSETVICSVLDHSPGGDSLAWRIRRVFQQRAFLSGSWHILPDGAGGAYVAWREGPGPNGPPRVVRVDANGVAPGWPDSGVAVDDPGSAVEIFQLARDESGGVIVLLRKYTDLSSRLMVQWLSSVGTPPSGWPPGGVQLSTTYSVLVYEGRMGTMRNGRVPVVWEESVAPMTVGETRSRFAIVGPTGVVTVDGRTHAIVCPAEGSQGEFAIARMDDHQTAVVWLESTGPFQTNVRVSALTDDLTVDTEASLAATADCALDGAQFSWRGDRLTGRTLEVLRIAPDGTRSSEGTFTLDSRSTSLDYFARANDAAGGALCMELAEGGLPVEGSRLCASCGVGADDAPWRVTSQRGDGSWRIQFRAAADVALDLRVFDIAGRSVASRHERLASGDVFALSSESLRLPVGWYRVRASGGGRVTETSLVVIR